MLNKIHIVSFDIPFPANYGGVIDVYYKLKALKESGVGVILHCFEYGRDQASELESICDEVYYYQRQMSPLKLLSKIPFIVNTRVSDDLLLRLAEDDYPILFEGLHSSYYALNGGLSKDRLFIRNHNVESDYYQHLSQIERNLIKKVYFRWESKKLKAFERRVVDYVSDVFTISESDHNYFQRKYSKSNLIGAFHQADGVRLPQGNGKYCFYHGNLSVGENNRAAIYLVDEVFSNIDTPLIIAGSGASFELKLKIESYDNVVLKEDISTEEIKSLLENAHINVLPTFQATGIKLKLLLSLFTGRFVIANDPMVLNTGLESLCSLANTSEEFRSKISELMEKDWVVESELNKREAVLSPFSNRNNVRKLINLLQ